MTDIISAAKKWLDETGVAYEVDEDGVVHSEVGWGSASYLCSRRGEPRSLLIRIEWNGSAAPWVGQAVQVLLELTRPAKRGEAIIDRRTGTVSFHAAVNFERERPTVAAVGRVLRLALDIANLMICAMRQVITGTKTQAQAMEFFASVYPSLFDERAEEESCRLREFGVGGVDDRSDD